MIPPVVIVVGAGPAGSIAARTLALAGVPVTLLERAPAFPRNKPCGGAISMRALRRFPWLEGPLADIGTHRIARLYLEGPDGDSAVIESDEPAVLMIRRWEFDALLVKQAVAAGATLVSGVDIVRARQTPSSVTIESRDGRRFDAPVVIAADGVHSIVARRLGLNPGWPAGAVAVDMMEETPVGMLAADPSTLWVSYGYTGEGAASGSPRAAEGYAYIFPKKDHVNVGIGYVLRHFKGEVAARPYDLQRDFIEHLRRRGLVRGTSVREHFTPFIIPVGGPLPRPAGGRVLLAGDAGGFVNGFTAEGIYYAMLTGELAGRAVVAAGAGAAPERMVDGYTRATRREVGAELRDSVLVQRYLFADRRRIARVIGSATGQPALTRTVLDYALGLTPYHRARRRIVAGAPAAAAGLLAHLAAHRLSRWARVATMRAPLETR
ncbi:MAG: NAD(P)/FAD-dependent oxidoreductase [Vicinamibacterales bacterium]